MTDLMYCGKCGQLNEDGKFCIRCGSPLAQAETQVEPEETAETISQPEVNPVAKLAENEHVKKAVDTSQQYFQFALNLLKKPAHEGTKVGENGFVNGIITQSLLIFFIPMITYLAVLALPSMFRPSFFDAVAKPWFYLLITLGFVNGAIFLAAKLGKTSASVKDVIGRFGALLVVPLALVLLAFVTALIRLGDVAVLALNFGLFGMLAAVALTIYSFKKESETPEQGLDALYGTLLTYLVLALVLVLIGRAIIHSVAGSFF